MYIGGFGAEQIYGEGGTLASYAVSLGVIKFTRQVHRSANK